MIAATKQQYSSQYKLLIGSGIFGASAALAWLLLFSNPIGGIVVVGVAGVLLVLFPSTSWIVMMGIIWVLPTLIIAGILFWKIRNK